MLQSGAGRRDLRLYYKRARRDHTSYRLYQYDESVRRGKNPSDRSRVAGRRCPGLRTLRTGLYLGELKIYGNNRTGLLVDITKIFTEREIDINSIHSKTSKQNIATISISFGTKGKDEMNHIIAKIRQVESVIDIERTSG